MKRYKKMSLEARSTKPRSNTTREYPEAGTYLARLVGLTDLGHQPGFVYQGKEIPSTYKVEFTYELVTTDMEDGRPFWVNEEVAVNDFEGDGITSTMMARVRCIDKANESNNGKDLTKLLGKPCMVTVSINDNGYPKLRGQAAVSGVPVGMPVPELRNDTFSFDMDSPDLDLWAKFPEFKQEKIRTAINFDETALAKELA